MTIKRPKFKLTMNSAKVYSLDELIANFNVKDILNHYKNDTLQKWLLDRSLENLFQKVSNLSDCDDNVVLAKKLLEIFEIPANSGDIPQQLELLKNDVKLKLIDNIVENPNDIILIKEALQKIKDNHYYIFEKNFQLYQKTFWEWSPLAIAAILMDKDLRILFEKYPEEKKKLPMLSEKLYTQRVPIMEVEKANGNLKTLFTRLPMQFKNILSESAFILSCNYKYAIIDSDLDELFPDHEVITDHLKELSSLHHEYKRLTESLKDIFDKPTKVDIKSKDVTYYCGHIKGLYFDSLEAKGTYSAAKIEIKYTTNIDPVLKLISGYRGVTNKTGNCLLPKGKKCIVLHMENGGILYEPGSNKEFKSEDIDEIPIFDGLELYSENPRCFLLYMEVEK